jgi:hypothetical protein
MQKLTSLFIALLLGGITAFAQADEEKIKQLLDAETADFAKMSFAEVVKKHWILDDKTVAMVTMPDGNHLQMKKDELLALTATPPEGHAQVRKFDYQFFMNGATALVYFAQEVSTAEGDKVNSHEMRYLEKVNGEWKIHASSVHQFFPKG